jgi:glycosyltransferase involved in cell wall biosynthesis
MIKARSHATTRAGPTDPGIGADSKPEADNRRVYIIARKMLLRNTRIFKQARTLTEAGYDVTVIGILPRGAPEHEQREGYSIIRLRIEPLYVTLPRRLRRAWRSLERALARVPRGYRRRVGRLRRRHRLLLVRLRRRRSFLVSAVRRVRGAWWRWRRRRQARWMRLVGAPAASIARRLHVILGAIQTVGRSLRDLRSRAGERGTARWPLRARIRALTRLPHVMSESLIVRLQRFLRWFAGPLFSIAFYPAVYRLVMGELGPPAIIHCNDLDTLLVGVLLARRHEAPLLYDAQELHVGVHTLPWWYRQLLTVQEHALIHRADQVTVVNDAIADVMAQKYRIHIDSVVLNCPPLDEEPAAAGGRTIREILGIPPTAVVLLYSGALGKNRGIENLVRALTHLDGTRLVILGEGPLRGALDDLIVELDLGGRVSFSDFVPHDEVPRFISSADVGVIPYEHVGVNHYLCSPSKLFHYIMAELPIACSDFPFLRKVVLENGIGAVFDPSKPESMAAAVRELVDTPGVHAACRERMKVVKRRYCWEQEEQRMLSVYAELEQRRAALQRARRRVKT